ETEAAHMKSTDASDEAWPRLMPYLDQALENLGDQDRMAIVFRFLERQSFHEVAVGLGVSEDAAKKRVSRALEKLHILFTQQGLTLGLSGMVAALSAKAVLAVPTGLLRSVVQAGLSDGMAAGPTVAELLAEGADLASPEGPFEESVRVRQLRT